jgi:predicted AAA+ superfamily ATPase
MEIDLGYTPQPKQRILHESPANEILYGGAAGPGKSHALRMAQEKVTLSEWRD